MDCTRWMMGIVGALVVTGCSQPREDDDPFGSGTGTASMTSPNPGSSGATTSGMSDSATSTTMATTAADSGTDETGEIKLDLGEMPDIPPIACQEGDPDCGCTAVDILFVIDNSTSMGDYQEGLGLAFPEFAATLAETLPAGTNVHVAVTSTEMGFSNTGNNQIFNGQCSFTGANGQDHEAFYVPPSQMNTGTNGAQGRLFDPGGGQTFFEFETDGDLAGAQAWFAGAANIGEGGSNIEMSAAPVGWVFDPINAATNDGFLRDEGAVLVVFFMQDEPDQSPAMIEGMTAGAWVLDRVAAAKQGCGGLECVIAGGFVEANACSADGNLPLDDFLQGMNADPVISELPFFAGEPQEVADDMNMLLSNTLADVIAQTCESIGPEG